ncbi:uncharacterized protein LOC144077173 [Stigmatopora argus]
MDSEDEGEVFSEKQNPVIAEGEEEEEEEDEEEDAKIFNAWMQRYRGGEHQKTKDEEQDEEAEEGKTQSRPNLESAARLQTKRRSSLPCLSTPSSVQLARLHSSTRAPVTAKTLLRRSSSRRLLPSQQEGNATERRASLIPPIPEAVTPEKKGQFRRRNVMSLSDADSMCLICHNDLKQGSGGIRELQCMHTFHRECIEEWLWRKQSCPTCHVQVLTPQQAAYWSSARVIVP